MVRLEQRLSLQQRLSPQQVLFSTLLQMPIMALEQRIKIELEQNPLLEEVTDIDIELKEQEETSDPVQEEIKESVDEVHKEELEKESEKEEEKYDFEDFLNDEDGYEYNPVTKEPQEEYHPDPAPVTLAEYVLSQFHFLQLSAEERGIGEYIIWNINEDGYLTLDTETIAHNLSTADQIVTPEQVEKVLRLIQTLEPVGIGARNLQECLIIQLREQENSNELAVAVLEKYFDDFKNKRYEKLIKNLGISPDELKQILSLISRLNPKPGEGYINANENYIIPDLLIEKVGNEFIPSINDTHVPQLRINNSYRRMIIEGAHIAPETKKYIQQKLESARWLINSIHQRKLTMIKVMKEIIKRQRDFFEKGHDGIKPMILKDIADAISMDISTISRVTSGKYVQTDYGVYELKYFFSDRMFTEDGNEVSTLQLKSQIKELIENEEPNNLLTDGEIAAIIAKTGVPIARRTVAKYREQMMIPVARLRRKI